MVPDDNVINKILGLLICTKAKFLIFYINRRGVRLGCKIHQNVKPFYVFITGGTGFGKSHLFKNIYLSLSK